MLSNHDNQRHRTRYEGREDRARAAAVLLTGLAGHAVPLRRRGARPRGRGRSRPIGSVDPGGRDGCRAPIPWNSTPEHGWATADPWLPWPPDADARNVEAQRADPASILHLYQRLLRCRRDSPALHRGDLAIIESVPADVVAWSRTFGGDRRTVLVNFGDEPAVVEGVAGIVDVASDGAGEGMAFDGQLGPAQALVVRSAT